MLQEGEERFPNYAEYLENAGNESDDDNEEHSSGSEDSSESSVVIGVNESSVDSETPLTRGCTDQEQDEEGAA